MNIGPLGGTGLLQRSFGCQEASVDESGPGGDQFADDHVLLEAVERVVRSRDGCPSQHLDGVLEGGGRQERVRAE